jgi:antitoxin (DNA-binding transcriptional repressor) of toxin-antitoxin stability system
VGHETSFVAEETAAEKWLGSYCQQLTPNIKIFNTEDAGEHRVGLEITGSGGEPELNVTNIITFATFVITRTVKVSDLKARLSAHLQYVKNGEELLVCDRNKPVARIIPCSVENEAERIQRLIARGVLEPPLKKRSSPVSWPTPPGNVPDEVMEKLWQEERDR